MGYTSGEGLLTFSPQTEIFRKVFHAIPDDMVTTWKQYKDFVVHHERMNKPVIDDDDPQAPPLARVPSETGDADAHGDDDEDTQKPTEKEERETEQHGGLLTDSKPTEDEKGGKGGESGR